jgi:hypothetical protein
MEFPSVEAALAVIAEAHTLWRLDGTPMGVPEEEEGRHSFKQFMERILQSNLATWNTVVEIDRRLHASMKELTENIDPTTEYLPLPTGDGRTILIFRDGNADIAYPDGTLEHFWETPDDPEIQVEYEQDVIQEVLSRSGRIGAISYEVPDAVEYVYTEELNKNLLEAMLNQEKRPEENAIIAASYFLDVQKIRNEFHELQKLQESWVRKQIPPGTGSIHSFTVSGIPVAITLYER